MFPSPRPRRVRQDAVVVPVVFLCILAAPQRLSAQMPPAPVPAGPPTYTFTLDECIDVALRNQPAIRARSSALGAAAGQRDVARSYYLPQIGFGARYAHLDQPRSVDFPSPFTGEVGDVFSDAAAYFGIARQAGSAAAAAALDNPNVPPFSVVKQAALDALPDKFRVGLLGENSLSTELMMVQPLWTGGKIDGRYRQAQLGVRAASADVAKSKQQTAFDVTQAYLGVQLARELTLVMDDAVGQLSAIERLIRALLDQGDRYVTTVDLHRVQAIRYMAESERVGARQAAVLAHEALRQAMGMDAATEFDIADGRLVAHRRDVELPAILGEAMVQRPELAKARIGVQIADLERKLARADYFPDLSLFGRMATIDDDGGYLNPNDRQEWSVGVNLGIPIFTGGRRGARQRQAQCDQARASYERKLAYQLVALEVQKAYLEYLDMS
ncbi:MAG: TolC family protein [Pirellulales bacterium]|nr:TolC family protein [Pirellulales bacterium]